MVGGLQAQLHCPGSRSNHWMQGLCIWPTTTAILSWMSWAKVLLHKAWPFQTWNSGLKWWRQGLCMLHLMNKWDYKHKRKKRLDFILLPSFHFCFLRIVNRLCLWWCSKGRFFFFFSLQGWAAGEVGVSKIGFDPQTKAPFFPLFMVHLWIEEPHFLEEWMFSSPLTEFPLCPFHTPCIVLTKS